MPFKSQAQRRWMHARHPAMAGRWERETPDDKKLPEKVAAVVPKKALVAAGALAVPYVVGKNVQKQQQQEQVMGKSAAFEAGLVDGKNVQKQQQQEQVMEKSAAFEAGLVDGMSKEALSPALRSKALGMRVARMYREAGGKGGIISSGIPTPSNIRANMATVKAMINRGGKHGPAMGRYMRAAGKDLEAANKAGGLPAMVGAQMNSSWHQTRGVAQELAKKK